MQSIKWCEVVRVILVLLSHGTSLVSMTHIAASRKPGSQLGCVIVETLDWTGALEHKETGIRRISAGLRHTRIDNLYIIQHQTQYVLLTEIRHKYFDHQENVVKPCCAESLV